MSGVPLRVVSYNVHGMRDDRPALVGLIRELAPDVLVVQEAPRRFRWRDRCASLAADAGLVVAAGGLPALGNLLLVSLRVAVHRTWCLRYPLTPGRHMRGAVFAELSVRDAGRFVVTGSHLATDPAERPVQAARWKSEMPDLPFIVAADLNEGPGGSAWRMVADGLTGDDRDVPTFPAVLPQRRIDGLFVSPGIAIERYEIIGSDLARRASDHLPVVADLLLPSA
ncbi:putative endonuclease/exonuclease/phosphatase-family protein [Actinoplanes missouriensis 431]|uniref:Putative endonuclease/exonuclease/phosphatase-family protein n=1 Tax=Actinoplanes missouriensis (strain ATCC 14538 / DSM 43046 / CBS 188.64 / JCM 3121 / NBRC 102363 / NCIMB 12654 / NRRL B-3342 / UNCC 431) TaxID=512565 RepID=I0H0X6_ACTM4|nr:endonuclease/exonuclease/phosphatase family protein [Actinoplanes missouriensis]BAL86663.1 putative endonuclease/exonuclease/phosphatase-family protein [Actinoplanes missouriensis 431]